MITPLDRYMEDFIILVSTKTPDGIGGWTETLTNGSTIKAAINLSKHKEVDVGDRDALQQTFNIIIRPEVVLKQNDIVKRVSTGKIYRIMTNSADNTIPAIAYESYAEVKAEVIVIDRL